MNRGGRGEERRQRGGFIAYTTGVVLVLCAMYLGILFLQSRHTNLASHRLRYSEDAAACAFSMLELVKVRLAEELHLHPIGSWEGELSGALALPCEGLVSYMADNASADAAEWLDRVLSAGWRDTLAWMMERDYPGCSVELKISLHAEQIGKVSGLESFTDPVEKMIHVTLESTAVYRRTKRTCRGGFRVIVYNPMPPVTTKFTLFVGNCRGGGIYNTYRNKENGEPMEGERPPLVCFNTPPDVTDDRTFTARLGGGSNPFRDREEAAASIRRRGYIFIGTQAPLVLNLTAGASLDDNADPDPSIEYGEFFHLYNPLTRNSTPGYYIVMDTPDFFKSAVPAPAPVPPGGGEYQRPYINFLYWGYHTEGADELTAGGIVGPIDTTDSSALHLFGTDDEPSRTIVMGDVRQRYIRFSYLAVDRDSTSNDEDLQRANLPPDTDYFISVRDSVEPAFRYVADKEEFMADLAREGSGEAPLRLLPIPSAMVNRNYFADLNLNGVMDPGEPVLDPGFPTFAIDPARFTYREMFSDYDSRRGYRNYMSLQATVPYMEMIDYMYYCGLIPPSSHPAYEPTFTPEEIERYRRAESVTLDFGDPVHRRFSGDEEEYGCYIRGMNLADAMNGGGISAVLRNRCFVEVTDEKEFFERYPLKELPGTDGTMLLTLDDAVHVRRGSLHLPPVLHSGDGIIVVEGDVVCEGMMQMGDSSLTVASCEGNVVLRRGVPQEAMWMAPSGTLRTEGEGMLTVKGSLAVAELDPDAAGGGWIEYPGGAADPTRYDEDGINYIDKYRAGLTFGWDEWAY